MDILSSKDVEFYSNAQKQASTVRAQFPKNS